MSPSDLNTMVLQYYCWYCCSSSTVQGLGVEIHPDCISGINTVLHTVLEYCITRFSFQHDRITLYSTGTSWTHLTRVLGVHCTNRWILCSTVIWRPNRWKYLYVYSSMGEHNCNTGSSTYIYSFTSKPSYLYHIVERREHSSMQSKCQMSPTNRVID